MKKIILALCLILWSCGDFTDSPFSDEVTTGTRNSNSKQLERIKAQPQPSGPWSFALLTDTHLDYEDTERIVTTINRQDALFTVHLGDMTMISSPVEYDSFTELIRRLDKPFFVAVGNHDVIVKGRDIYKKIFGPYNLSFEYGGFRFIVFNDIGAEYILDFDWLNNEVDTSFLPVFIFSHAGLSSPDVQSDEDMRNYAAVMEKPQVKALFYGHKHMFEEAYITAADGQQKLIQQISTARSQYHAIVHLNGPNIAIDYCYKGICSEEVNFTFTY